MSSIGFVGLGSMGAPIAGRLLQLMHKDIRLALDAARGFRVPLPSAAVADSMLSAAADLGYGHRDIAAFFEVLGQMAASPGQHVSDAA